jgi:hypothetical protein
MANKKGEVRDPIKKTLNIYDHSLDSQLQARQMALFSPLSKARLNTRPYSVENDRRPSGPVSSCVLAPFASFWASQESACVVLQGLCLRRKRAP